MCGVIGLRCAGDRPDLGAVASRLLRMLEYRGYDSTGAAIQPRGGAVVLRKGVGSPTAVTKRLGIDRLGGMVFCGQVRWATFGVVTTENAQPHEVRCRTHLYGAHNGNITNCGPLKDWLAAQGHQVASDNDGEMLVHTVEHHFALELGRLRPAARKDPPAREAALKAAIIEAAKRMVGSYAAVVVDPATQLAAAVKAGSSLYMGIGSDEAHGPFIIASSDLGSVLSMTKVLVPMSEGEFALYTHERVRHYDLRSGRGIRKTPVRSMLRVEETELKEPFRYFMQQEIFSQPAAVRRVLTLFLKRSPLLEAAGRFAASRPALAKGALGSLHELSGRTGAGSLKQGFERLAGSAAWRRFYRAADGLGRWLGGEAFESAMGGFLDELAAMAPPAQRPALRLADGLFLLEEADDAARRCSAFADLALRAHRAGRSIYLLACGTSFHAAKVASVFFNKIAGLRVVAMLPGDFRAEGAESLRDGDLVAGISQSGETKDLIDVINLVRRSRRRVAVATVVNNVNSTLALEKTDLYIPLFCGPEVAVPATKSFMNQLAVLYALALKAAERTRPGAATRHRLENFLRVPGLLEETLEGAREDLESAAVDLCMAPSIHILATGMQGVAKEGALKVREVVLNHTEGYEAAEFKHGPNTILGVNTVFGLEAVRSLLAQFSAFSGDLARRGLPARSLARLYKAVADFAFDDAKPGGLDDAESAALRRVFEKHDFFRSLGANYPLVFVTGPSERDVHLTISQINTHKIRGTDVYIIAEEDAALRDAVSRPVPPRFEKSYRWGYIVLPKTGDDLLPFFTSTIALQLLALRMSVGKLTLLDKLEIPEHGVHPDSPKNVSKSITVD